MAQAADRDSGEAGLAEREELSEQDHVGSQDADPIAEGGLILSSTPEPGSV
jgi:hypothetical protein